MLAERTAEFSCFEMNDYCFVFLLIFQGQEQCQDQSWGAVHDDGWNDSAELETVGERLL